MQTGNVNCHFVPGQQPSRGKGLSGRRWRLPGWMLRRGGQPGLDPGWRAKRLKPSAEPEHPGGGKPPMRCRMLSIYNPDCGPGGIRIAHTLKGQVLSSGRGARDLRCFPGVAGAQETHHTQCSECADGGRSRPHPARHEGPEPPPCRHNGCSAAPGEAWSTRGPFFSRTVGLSCRRSSMNG